MSYELFIVKRYFQAKRRGGFISFITFIAIAGVMLGTAALIIALTILGGFEKEIKEKVIGFSAHIQVVGFQNQALPDYEKVIAKIRSEVPGIKAVSAFATRETIIRSKSSTEGVLLKGVDEAADVSSTRQHILEGAYDLGSGFRIPKLVIGKRLANKLNVRVGDRVTLFGIGENLRSLGSPLVRQFEVSGIYETGMAEYDDIYVYTSLPAAQKLLRLEEAVTGFDIILNDLNEAPVVANRIQELLGYPYYARTVFQLYRNLFTWIDLQKKPTPIILGLIIIVATVNIIGTLLMLVMEKTNEIGILKTMGATSRGIRKIFIAEGLTIGLIGTFLGNALAYGLCWLQQHEKILSLPEHIYFMSSVPILLRAENFVLVSAIALILCLLATLIPSALAARLKPIAAIRFA